MRAPVFFIDIQQFEGIIPPYEYSKMIKANHRGKSLSI